MKEIKALWELERVRRRKKKYYLKSHSCDQGIKQEHRNETILPRFWLRQSVSLPGCLQPKRRTNSLRSVSSVAGMIFCGWDKSPQAIGQQICPCDWHELFHLHFLSTLWYRYCYYFHVTHEETGVRRGDQGPGLCPQQEVELGLHPRWLDIEMILFTSGYSSFLRFGSHSNKKRGLGNANINMKQNIKEVWSKGNVSCLYNRCLRFLYFLK